MFPTKVEVVRYAGIKRGSIPRHSQMFLRIVIFNCSTTPIRFVRIV
nr:MAG TPA: hypothetical protein [Crassvirales sp.]